MKKIKFVLQIPCYVGWDDEEEIIEYEVGIFDEVLETAFVLKEYERTRGLQQDPEIKQKHRDIKEEMSENTDEEINMLGEVEGIYCFYEDEKGVQAKMELSDHSGVSGWVTVNSEEYENEYKKRLADSKRLATEILSL